MINLHRAVFFSIIATAVHLAAAPIGSQISYQGNLSQNGQPANGTYDLRLTLYDVEEGGAPVGPTLTNANVTVAEGLIRTTMDFGAAVFDGTALWLEIAVRTGGSQESFASLSSRQPLLAAPYAVYALSAGTVPDGSITGETIADGQVVRSINGLADHVALVAGTNITVTQQGTSLTVSATVPEGPQGPKGDQGDVGPVGPLGPQGEPGDSLWSLTGTSLGYMGGKVGVGTTSPATLLHAHGSPVANRGQLSLSSPAGQDAILSLYDADVFSAYLWYDPIAQDLRLQNVRTGDLNLNPYGGNVGIGSNNPGAKLHVAGAVAIGNTIDASPPAGTIRWNGTDFEGYTGTGWVTLAGGGSTDAWSLTGNSGTDPTSNFLGTVDSQPFELRVEGHRALRLESNPGSEGFVNVVGGHVDNRIYSRMNLGSEGHIDYYPFDVFGSVIAGGGSNTISSDQSTDEYPEPLEERFPAFASSFSTISGGKGNRIDGSPGSAISGGVDNWIESTYGYYLPHAAALQSEWCNISGGFGNGIDGAVGSAICGGGWNLIYAWGSEDYLTSWCSIAGGRNNSISGAFSSIGGGRNNTLFAEVAVIGGGQGNRIVGTDAINPTAFDCVISGGGGNGIESHEGSAIGGGQLNQIVGDRSTISGG